MSFAPHPASVGRYVIRREIGSGGQSRVYEADDPQHHRTVALKLFTIDDGDDTAVRAIRREIEALGKFDDHPNVVTLHDSGVHAGQPFLVMTYYASGSLMALIKRGGARPITEVVRCARDMAAALVSLHEASIIHRDIKPHNVFIGEHGFVLGDLGISMDTSGDRSVSQSSDMFTPPYSAPEVIEGRASTRESDMYALGATLYHMAAGRRPFEGSGVELQRQILNDPPRPIERSDLPRDFGELLTRLLSKRSSDRWSAEAFARRIPVHPISPPGAATATQLRAPGIDHPLPVERTRLASRVRPRHWLIATFVIVGVVALAVGLGLYLGSGGEAEPDDQFDPPLPAGDPFEEQPISSPTDLVVTATSTEYRLTWTAIDEADAYRIVSVDASGSREFAGDTEVARYAVQRLAAGAVCFEVSAVRGTAISAEPAFGCADEEGAAG
jgi:serine/threonine protein kinase